MFGGRERKFRMNTISPNQTSHVYVLMCIRSNWILYSNSPNLFRQNINFIKSISPNIIAAKPIPPYGSLVWPDPSAQALSIRDDKRPREKGLVQVQYQTRSFTPSPSRGVNKYSSLYVAPALLNI